MMHPPYPVAGTLVGETEIRRYLRHASVVLATVEGEALQRAQLLRRALHWVGAACRGIEQLLRDAEGPAVPVATVDPLTPPTRSITIDAACGEPIDSNEVER